ncbi:hypothetical protein [Streptomyces sp. NRRL B-1347]|uniref:hypothetical protein n=1 Tax=Streptomyces sp. NRRL B-1347 TaxID=1476877 RepID=UPI0004CAFBD2|nr:hypothetical protein [Streptomyces sp. NRRL B-1347]
MSAPPLLAFRPAPDRRTWTISDAAPHSRTRTRTRTRTTTGTVPNLIAEPNPARHPVQHLAQHPAHDFDFSNLDAYGHAAHTVQASSANVCDPHHTCVAKLRQERLPACEIQRVSHIRLRETATSPNGSAAPGATASGPAQRHRDHAARHEI